ncbi:MAG TPA: helix-turn-helix domain-containing protein [Candidatus Sulfotelmatobacter sp.]|nr:helix-turn-helix domain-containing protein [Candidatus Sulfotelmatobacter sp.]
MDTDRLYSLADVAKRLSVSIETVRLHVWRGSLKTTRVGRRQLVTPAELHRVMNAGLPSLRQEPKCEAVAV